MENTHLHNHHMKWDKIMKVWLNVLECGQCGSECHDTTIIKFEQWILTLCECVSGSQFLPEGKSQAKSVTNGKVALSGMSIVVTYLVLW